MSSSNKNKRFAKSLLRLSQTQDGRIQKDKIEEILTFLRNAKPLGLKSILRFLLAEVRRHEYTHHASVEIGCKNEGNLPEVVDKMLQKKDVGAFEFSISENPKLIAGFKLRLGDDVIEDSVQNRLQNLTKSFT
jgi:F0F1-type ATP synthase delta subunit